MAPPGIVPLLAGLLLAAPSSASVPRPAATSPVSSTSASAPASALGYSRLICSFEEDDFGPRDEFPYTAKDLARLDQASDSRFYSEPRLVTHIDDGAIRSLTDYYAEELAELADAKRRRGGGRGRGGSTTPWTCWICARPGSATCPGTRGDSGWGGWRDWE